MRLFKSFNARTLSIFALCLGAYLPLTQVQACPSNPYIGGMCAFGGNYSIRGWAYAHGQLLPISQYTAVFSLLGTTYGGDGRTTFGLPDLRGRAIMGVGTGPGLPTIRWGERAGSETVSLTVAQIPSHNHTATSTLVLDVDESQVQASATLHAHNTVGLVNSPSSNMLAENVGSSSYSATAPAVAMASDAIEMSAVGISTLNPTTTLSNTGSSAAHENRMPYLAVNWLIALEGTYPSRN